MEGSQPSKSSVKKLLLTWGHNTNAIRLGIYKTSFLTLFHLHNHNYDTYETNFSKVFSLNSYKILNMNLKSLFSILLVLLLFQIMTTLSSCCKCCGNDFFYIDDLVDNYFKNYQLNQKIVFQSVTKIDTLFVKESILDTFTDCGSSIVSRTITLKNEFMFGEKPLKIEILGRGDRNNTLLYFSNSIRITDFSSMPKSGKFNNFPNNDRVETLETLKVNGLVFQKVQKLRLFDDKSFFFFAPEKGLIMYTNSLDTLTIKN